MKPQIDPEYVAALERTLRKYALKLHAVDWDRCSEYKIALHTPTPDITSGSAAPTKAVFYTLTIRYEDQWL